MGLRSLFFGSGFGVRVWAGRVEVGVLEFVGFLVFFFFFFFPVDVSFSLRVAKVFWSLYVSVCVGSWSFCLLLFFLT